MEGMEKISALPEEEKQIREDALFLGQNPDEAVERYRAKMRQATTRLQMYKSEKAVKESAKEIGEMIEKANITPKTAEIVEKTKI